MTLYTCTKCHEVLPPEAFGINTKNGQPYRRTECKRCLRARSRKSYALRRASPRRWDAELLAMQKAFRRAFPRKSPPR